MTARMVTRTDRAAGIVTRQECEPLDNGAWRVRDTATGSGEWHTASTHGCSCADYRRRGGICKHMRAIILEEQALAQYCAAWDARAEDARIAAAPGNFLDGPFDGFADELLTAPAPTQPAPVPFRAGRSTEMVPAPGSELERLQRLADEMWAA